MEKSGHNSCNESLIVVFSYGLHLFITADCLIANDCVLHYIYICKFRIQWVVVPIKYVPLRWLGRADSSGLQEYTCLQCLQCLHIWKSKCLLRSCFRFPRFSVLFHIFRSGCDLPLLVDDQFGDRRPRWDTTQGPGLLTAAHGPGFVGLGYDNKGLSRSKPQTVAMDP
jgi:hypothetical protein